GRLRARPATDRRTLGGPGGARSPGAAPGEAAEAAPGRGGGDAAGPGPAAALAVAAAAGRFRRHHRCDRRGGSRRRRTGRSGTGTGCNRNRALPPRGRPARPHPRRRPRRAPGLGSVAGPVDRARRRGHHRRSRGLPAGARTRPVLPARPRQPGQADGPWPPRPAAPGRPRGQRLGPAARRRCAAGAAVAGRWPLRYRSAGARAPLAGRIRRALARPGLPRHQRAGRQQRPGRGLGTGSPARPRRPGRTGNGPGRPRRRRHRRHPPAADPAWPGRRWRGRPGDPAGPVLHRRPRSPPAPEPGLMSLILDALRKSEAERQRGQAPDLFAVPAAAPVRPARPWKVWGGYALAGLLAVVLVFLVWRRPDPPAAPVTGEEPLVAPAETTAVNPAAGVSGPIEAAVAETTAAESAT